VTCYQSGEHEDGSKPYVRHTSPQQPARGIKYILSAVASVSHSFRSEYGDWHHLMLFLPLWGAAETVALIGFLLRKAAHCATIVASRLSTTSISAINLN